MPPRKDPKGKTPATLSVANPGPSRPIQSPASSDAQEAELIQTLESTDLVTQGQLAALQKQQEDTNATLAVILQKLSQEPAQEEPNPIDEHLSTGLLATPQQTRSTSPSQIDTKLPPVPTITKLKGRENYKTWTYQIQIHAEIYGVWDAIIHQSSVISHPHKAFALALISHNTIPSIQTNLTAFKTAYAAWSYLVRQYNQMSIAQVVY
jgi:hypothetical protein